MSVVTLKGVVEGGQVRLLDGKLPEETKVLVVVPEVVETLPRMRSPRLLNPADARQFSMEVTEVREGKPDAEI